MRQGRLAERLQVVTALKGRHNLAAAACARDLADRPGGPGEVVRFQQQRGERVAGVGVETGGDQDQLRGEVLQRPHQGLERRPPGLARRAGGGGGVDHVAVAAGGAGARPVGELLDRGEEQARIGPHHSLRAVAVVHVEIHHRHPRKPLGQGRVGRHRHAGEQAEPHRLARQGVVPRRPHRAERPRQPAGRGLAHGLHRRAAGALGGDQAPGRHGGVRIELDQAARGLRPGDGIDVGLRMHPQQVLARNLRRLPDLDAGRTVLQRAEHRLQPRRAFRVALAGAVGEHVGVGVDGDVHGACWLGGEDVRGLNASHGGRQHSPRRG